MKKIVLISLLILTGRQSVTLVKGGIERKESKDVSRSKSDFSSSKSSGNKPDKGHDKHKDNGVRDHGKGEGRDNHGNGKGQGKK